MGSKRIQSGDTEQIIVVALDDDDQRLTGKSDLFVRVRRMSDGFYLDFGTMTFTATGSLSSALTESNAALSPGFYELTGGLDTSAITNMLTDDTLIVEPTQTPGTDAVLDEGFELEVGQWPNQIKELWQVHGLEVGNPLVVDSSLPAGSRKIPADGSVIDQDVTVTGNVTTVERN